jgi:hypothetical protein
MKTKLYMIVFIIAITSIIAMFLLSPKPGTPYSGVYHASSANEELVLNSNNSFDIYIVYAKYSINVSGKYQITNNHIKLLTKNKTDSFYIKDISSGIVTGSVINFMKTENGSSIIFTKS